MRKLPILLLVLLLWCFSASAQEAEDVTATCAFSRNGRTIKAAEMLDRSDRTYFALAAHCSLEVVSAEELSGVYLRMYDHATECSVEVPQGEDWQEIARIGDYLTQWIPLPEGTTSFRIVNETKSRSFFSEMYLYGAGDKPAAAHDWHTLDHSDLLLLVAHPDDELLWFGGLLPTYAGERGLDVQVVYLVPTGPLRRLELLDGLWTCGVTAYPGFLQFRDLYSEDLRDMYKLWEQKAVWRGVTRVLRQYKPLVLVSQDINGEYGHGAHRAAGDSCIQCIPLAADPEEFPDSAETYGTWEVQKLYLHLWPERQVKLNWHKPLSAFGGKDAFTVAVEAMNCHASQVKRGWALEDGGDMDNSLFGLVYTAVGEDEAGDDLMEHVTTRTEDAH